MKYLLLYTFLIAAFFANAQQSADNTKFIEVSGSAEISLKPDEVEFEIQLGEYNDGKKLVKIDEVEKEFYGILEKNGISAKSLQAGNNTSYSYSYWWSWWYYYRNYTDRRMVRFTVKENTDILKLLKDFDKKQWVNNLTIVSSKSTDILKYRKQVKMEAMKAARDKAAYLLESIGEELDGIISVVEVPESENYYRYGYPFNNYRQQSTNSNVVVNAGNSGGGGNDGVENMAEIKVRYEIKAKFKIK